MSTDRFKIVESEFNDRPILQFWDTNKPEAKRPFMSFGWQKADIIISNFDQIRRFRDAHSRSKQKA